MTDTERLRAALVRIMVAADSGNPAALPTIAELAAGWECVSWKAGGGYGNRTAAGKENAAKERLWFSPFCLKPARARSLFDALTEHAS